MSGKNLDLTIDQEILKINSPKKYVGGPYSVVFKNIDERWAIVALDWDGKPRLGIRWFWDKLGNPLSRSNPTWLVIPSALANSILDGLPLDFQYRKSLEQYLNSEIKGSDL